MPSFEDLENPDSNLATEIISEWSGIRKVFSKNRSQLKYSDLPKNLVQALVAQRTSVLNTQALTERNITSYCKPWNKWWSKYLTQQLAKQFHGEGSKFLPFRIVQKVKEWIIAIRLEGNILK
jgi:penicillin-binding protein 1A